VVDVAGRVTDAIRLWPERVSQIAVDTIGIGAGVADILRRTFGDIVVDVNSSLRLDDGQNYNLRARMWRDMLVWIKAQASLPSDPELYTDLTALQYSYRGGLLLIESKERHEEARHEEPRPRRRDRAHLCHPRQATRGADARLAAVAGAR